MNLRRLHVVARWDRLLGQAFAKLLSSVTSRRTEM